MLKFLLRRVLFNAPVESHNLSTRHVSPRNMMVSLALKNPELAFWPPRRLSRRIAVFAHRRKTRDDAGVRTVTRSAADGSRSSSDSSASPAGLCDAPRVAVCAAERHRPPWSMRQGQPNRV